jgi:hypothetical protein
MTASGNALGGEHPSFSTFAAVERVCAVWFVRFEKERGESTLWTEGIDDTDAAVVMPVVEVLGVESVAAELQGGGDHGGIPVADVEASLDLKGLLGKLNGGFDQRLSGHDADHVCDFFAGEAEMRFAERDIHKILENLHGKAELGFHNQPLGNLVIGAIRRCPRNHVDKYICIEEDHYSRFPSWRSWISVRFSRPTGSVFLPRERVAIRVAARALRLASRSGVGIG